MTLERGDNLEAQQGAPDDIGRDQPESAHIESAIALRIAHDLNNLITPLLAFPDAIRFHLQEGDSDGHLLVSAVETAGKDMARMVARLVELAGSDHGEPETLDINSIVSEVVKDLEAKLEGRRVEIGAHLAKDLLVVNGVHEQLAGVVHCLSENALDAIAEVGRVQIRTANVYVDREGQHGRLPVGEYVEVSVSDTGEGIASEVRDRIFEPLFTTRKKVKGQGAGLGLSIANRVIREHGGLIRFQTAPGKGSTFNLYLPISRDQGTLEESDDQGNASFESALVVDDDAQQRDIIARIFEMQGYQVSTLPSGDDAVSFVAERAGSGNANRLPDVIILDVVMENGMDGKEACKRILEIQPDQPIVLMSGLMSRKDMALGDKVGNVAYLTKPLTWKKISRALDRIVRTKAASPGEGGLVKCDQDKLLIVDDEDGIRRVFRMILLAAFPKMNIEVASNGKEAVDMFMDGHHAVIIMDLQMPEMNGLDAFSEIRTYCSGREWTPPSVMFCTGFAPPSAVEKIVSTETSHCLLTKPVSGDRLILAVKQRLSG